MATNLYIDLDANRLVRGLSSMVPANISSIFRGDVIDLNLYFLRQTGISGAPYLPVDQSAASVSLALGSKTGMPTSGTWTLDGASLAYDVTAAAVQTALRTSQSDNALTVVGSMAAGFTITWGSVGTESALVADVSGLLPECSATVVERRAGSGSVKEQQFVRVRLSPGASLTSFSDITSTITATVSTVAGGSGSVNEVQKISLNKVPITGSWTITVPADTRSVTAAVVAGVFTTTANHGFVVGQPVVGTGFTNEANWTEGTTYYVKATPSATTFTISATSGGAALTTATADAGSGTITTVSRTTAPVDPDATAAEIKLALESLDSIGSGNVTVTGIPGEYYVIAYRSAKALANLPPVTVDVSSLEAATGQAGTLTLSLPQLSDIIGPALSASLWLEIAVDTQTVISQEVTVFTDLIA